MRKAKCPHDNIAHCPLYVASHDVQQLGCVKDAVEKCEVASGRMNYNEAVARLRIERPKLVAELEWKEDAAKRRDQRARNLRLNGVH